MPEYWQSCPICRGRDGGEEDRQDGDADALKSDIVAPIVRAPAAARARSPPPMLNMDLLMLFMFSSFCWGNCHASGHHRSLRQQEGNEDHRKDLGTLERIQRIATTW